MAKHSYETTQKLKSGETVRTTYGRDRSDDDDFGKGLADVDLIDRGIEHSIKNGDVPHDNG